MKFRFASMFFVCFMFVGVEFSSLLLLSLDLYFLKQPSVPLWSADARLQVDQLVLISVKMTE